MRPGHGSVVNSAVRSAGPLPAPAWAGVLAALVLTVTGCSVSSIAVDRLGNALAAGGTTYSADDDPQFVAQAVPFSLKLMESLLAERPRHRELLQAAAAGFTQYGYAFLQLPADEVAVLELQQAEDLRGRARRMYLRAHEYGLRGLEVGHPGFRALLTVSPPAAAALTTGEDAGLLYWTAASLAAAIGLAKDDPALVGDLPKVQALVDRALQLEESFDDGAIHVLLISFTMARPDLTGPRLEVAAQHYARALELSQSGNAGAHVAWAEAVCEPGGDRQCFEAALHAALAIDADARPACRLANLVMQRRASFLLQQIDRRFLPALPAASSANGVQP